MLHVIDIIYYLIIYVSYPIGLFSVTTALLVAPDLLQYGKTLSNYKITSSYLNLFSTIYKLQVKRSWFIHFYYLSTILSISNVMYDYVYYKNISINSLFFMHSFRRLIETYSQNKNSKSTSYMNISHYLVGIWFYFNFNFLQFYKQQISHKDSIKVSHFIIFISLNVLQCVHHLHLQSLRKYTIPHKYMFKRSYCAHYFIEILIYLSLMWFDNFSLETVLPFIWTFFNLSVSAHNTKNWYIKKFNIKPKDQLHSLIPLYSI